MYNRHMHMEHVFQQYYQQLHQHILQQHNFYKHFVDQYLLHLNQFEFNYFNFNQFVIDKQHIHIFQFNEHNLNQHVLQQHHQHLQQLDIDQLYVDEFFINIIDEYVLIQYFDQQHINKFFDHKLDFDLVIQYLLDQHFFYNKFYNKQQHHIDNKLFHLHVVDNNLDQHDNHHNHHLELLCQMVYRGVEAVALRAIGALDRAEEDANLLSALLESLEGEPLVEPLVTTSSTAVGAEVTVTMLTFVAAANTGCRLQGCHRVISPQPSLPFRDLTSMSGMRALLFVLPLVAAEPQSLRGAFDEVACTGNGGLAENSPSCYGGQFLVEKFSLHVLSYDGSTGIVDMKAEGPQSAECDGAEFQSDDNMITIENDQGCGLSNYEYTVRYCPDQDHVIVNLVKPYNARVILQSQACQSIMQIETVVSDGSFAPQVSVPLAVLDQISGGSSGPVAITTGKLPMQFARDIEAVGAAKARMDLNVSDAEAAPALATQPFSITVYDSNGEPIRGIQLAQPMTLQLAEDANDSIACAFFNQTSFRWSTSGLRRVRPNMGNASTTPSGAPVPLICETDHLSIFSGVIAIPAEDMEGYVEVPFEESNVANGGISPGTGGGDSVQNPGNGGGVVVDVVDQVLRCTRAAGIFSADGMNAVGRGAWTSSSSATALFVSLALFGAAAFAAFARDISRNQTKWMGQLMSLSYNDNEQEEEDEEEEKEEKARSLCKYCILVLQGLQAGVDPESLELAILVRTVGSKQGGELTKGKSPLYAAAVKLADIINVSSGYAKATNLFLEANWLARMLLLFPAVHRSLAAGHGSLIYSRTSKVVVIFLKIFFAGALAALFFQSGASGNDSEAGCIEGAGLGITLLLGLASALVSDLMIYGLVSLRRQNFKSAHGNVELQLKVKEWRVRNLLFWASWLRDTGAGVTHTLEDAAIGQSMRSFEGRPGMAARAVQAPFRAWDGPSAADFRVPIPHEASAQGGQLRALGAAPQEARPGAGLSN
ncbi:unnamed protein product [Symbiodinium sp. KB8]|nr:unnamed protein product [Symbiodinium sp. KB8]